MLKRNIVANYIGTGWTAIMGIAFVPLYVKYLGDEAYGVVGIAAAIQAYLSFLDAGLTPMLAREMSRYSGGAHSAESIRSLLRVVELWAWTIGVLAMGAIWLAAPWIASDWLRAETLPPDTIAHALRIMAVVVGLRFIEALYRGCLVGLQRQVTSNMVSITASTFRGVGAIGVLVWWSPTLDAFFWWQGAVSLGSVIAYLRCTNSALPKSHLSLATGITALRAVWPFAKGMLGSSALALAITQTDKLLLTRLLDLSEYGRYFVALAAASAVSLSAGPVIQAFYPRLVVARQEADNSSFVRTTHRAAQLVAVVSGAPCALLLAFSPELLLAWTDSPELAGALATPLRLLAVGNLLAASIGVVHHAQLATGWVSVSNWVNVSALVLLVPMLLLVVPRFGLTGAASTWVVLNVAQLIALVPMIFKRILPGEIRTWCTRDIAVPTMTAIAVCYVCKWIAGDGCQAGPTLVAVLATTLVFAAALAALTTPLAGFFRVRMLLGRFRRGMSRSDQ